MCLGSFPLHRHLLNSESTPSTQTEIRKKQVWSLLDFFFQWINQMPRITQMIEIQLFAKWYTVLINLNLHCMRLELIFLFLILGNLACGADWINHSSFPFSGCVNLCSVTVALDTPYPVGLMSSASWWGQGPDRTVIMYLAVWTF